MNARISTLAAALTAAGITAAYAQATVPASTTPPPLYDQVTAKEYGTPPVPAEQGPLTFVNEPTASLSSDQAPGAEVGKQLVDQINGDEKLKGSKITVVPEDGAVTLVGTTQTRAQAQQVAQMAAEKVGADKVVNAIRPSEIYIEVAPPQDELAQAGTDQGQADSGQADSGQAQAGRDPSQPANDQAQPQPAK